MTLIRFWLRTDVRARWRTWVLWSVLVGFGGGVALTAFAGARRTNAAVPQMLSYSRPDDGSVVFGQFCPAPHISGAAANSLAPLPVAARVLRLPEVAAFQRQMYLFMSDRPSVVKGSSLNVFATADAQAYRALDRPLIVAGRVPIRRATPTRCSMYWQRRCCAHMSEARSGCIRTRRRSPKAVPMSPVAHHTHRRADRCYRCGSRGSDAGRRT